MQSIVEWWRERNRRKAKEEKEYKRIQATEKASELFDVSVYKNELWLTYNRNHVCPMRLFEGCSNVAEVICMLRNYYVKRQIEDEYDIMYGR